MKRPSGDSQGLVDAGLVLVRLFFDDAERRRQRAWQEWQPPPRMRVDRHDWRYPPRPGGYPPW